MAEIVQISHLSKQFGSTVAVDDLSFHLQENEILGLVGPNGAGKSSTVKMILGFMKPDSGTVLLFGQALQEKNKDSIGYLPEERALYKNIPALELIIYLATLKGMPAALAKAKALQLLQQFGLGQNLHKTPKELSKGMNQMIQFIITIIHEPKLMILDEPFSGLDPLNTQIMQQMIADLRKRGKAVILCTHQMNKVEQLCDRVLMMQNGKNVLYGRVDEIRQRFVSRTVYVETDREFQQPDCVTALVPASKGFELELKPDATPQQLLHALLQQGVELEHFERKEFSFEEIFIRVAGAKNVKDTSDLQT